MSNSLLHEVWCMHVHVCVCVCMRRLTLGTVGDEASMRNHGYLELPNVQERDGL